MNSKSDKCEKRIMFQNSSEDKLHQTAEELNEIEAPPVLIDSINEISSLSSAIDQTQLYKTNNQYNAPGLISTSKVMAENCSYKHVSTDQQSHFSTSMSTLTSISEYHNPTSSESGHPSQHLQYLRNIHRRTKQRKQFRQFLRVLHYIVFYILPVIGIISGILGILIGHFVKIDSLFVSGCVLLIVTFGFILQSCFWARSLPNKFKAKEIIFNINQNGSISSNKNDTQADLCSAHAEETPSVMSKTTSKHIPSVYQMSIDPATARRISLAYNRATANLSAALKHSMPERNGVLNLARRLTMAQCYGDYINPQDLQGGNDWTAGRRPHGICREQPWNDIGTRRYYD